MKNLAQRTVIKVELVKQLLQQAPTVLYAGAFLTAIIFFSLYGHSPFTPLLIWYTTNTFIILARFALIRHLKNKLTIQYDRKSINRYTLFYTIGALLSGLSWSSLIFLNSPDQTTMIQLFILVIVIGMPMAGLSTNATLPSAFYAFTVPLLATLVLWSLLWAPGIEIKFTLAAIIYSVLVISAGKHFYRNLYLSIQRGFENQQLVEELRQGNAQLQELAYLDHLTGMPNRRQFQLNAERTLARVRKNNASMALMLIDIDNFKQVNDNYGHEAGDELLMELSHKIKYSIRQNDMVTHSDTAAARLGGDEFIVLLECEHKDIDVEPAARRILNNIRTAVRLNEIDVIPSVSIGIALAPEHSIDLRILMSYADQAMYETKQNGGNGYTIYGEEETFLTTMILETGTA